MAKREINVFNVSFIDLLSGALGAVLILFIIIPKLTGDIKLIIDRMEQFEQLQMEVKDIESMMSDFDKMMSKLDKSIPKAEMAKVQQKFNELEKKIKSLTQTVTKLDAEIKQLQDKAAQCDEQRKKLQEQKKKLEQQVEEMKKRMNSHDAIVKQLEKEIEDLKAQLAKCDSEKQSIQQEVEAKKQEVVVLTDAQKASSQEIEKLKEQLKNAQEKITQQQKEIKECKADLGFKFSGKKVLFVVDTSGSMTEEPETEKLKEVQAGIKMMIATMDNSYEIDVLRFPESKDKRYGYKFGKLKKVNEGVKYDVYRYLSNLEARGCTPTRDVMEFVLSAPAYSDVGTIIYLSDGVPTVRVNTNDCTEDNISDLLSTIKGKNSGKRVINCIGVGKDFRTQSSSDKKVKFMKDLASQNKGFYIGF